MAFVLIPFSFFFQDTLESHCRRNLEHWSDHSHSEKRICVYQRGVEFCFQEKIGSESSVLCYFANFEENKSGSTCMKLCRKVFYIYLCEVD